MTPLDSLVDSYLGAVARAAADLPPQRRDELLADLREHITTARAELDPETETGVRAILDRLGDPTSIAAEARRDEPPGRASLPAAVSTVVPRRSRFGVWIGIAVAVVLGVVLVTCLAGVLGLFAYRATPGVERPGWESVPADAPTPSPSHAG